MSEDSGRLRASLTKFPIRIPNDARYIAPIIEFIRDVIQPEQLTHDSSSHWDYYLGEVVEFTKDGVSMAYDWNESWGHELTTKGASEQQLKLVRDTAERIAAHCRPAP